MCGSTRTVVMDTVAWMGDGGVRGFGVESVKSPDFFSVGIEKKNTPFFEVVDMKGWEEIFENFATSTCYFTIIYFCILNQLP